MIYGSGIPTRDTKIQFQFFPENGNKKAKLSLNNTLLGKNTPYTRNPAMSIYSLKKIGCTAFGKDPSIFLKTHLIGAHIFTLFNHLMLIWAYSTNSDF